MKKRGISEIVSYTLLIVIAITLAVIIFAFLKVYVPKDKPECMDGINLIVESYKCETGKLFIMFENRGLFKVHRAFVRIGKEDEFKQIISQANPFTLISAESNDYVFPQNSTYELGADVSSIVTAPGEYVLEIQPAIKTNERSDNPNTLALCPTITQRITCS